MSLRSFWKALRPAGIAAGPDERIERAHDLAEAGRDAEARALCNDILAVQSDQPRALHLQGILALRALRPGEARGLINRAVALDPRNHLFRFNLGNAHVALGDAAAAADAFGEAVRIKPDYLPALFNLGKALSELKQPAPALEALRTAHALAPHDVAVSAEFAHACYRQAATSHLIADYALAAEAFAQVLALPGTIGPGRGSALLFIGDALSNCRRYGEALAFLRELEALEPDNIEALAKIANCYAQMGRMPDALPYDWRIARLEPAHFPVLSTIIGTHDYLSTMDASANSAQRFELAKRFSSAARRTAWPNPRDPGRRLRLGYVSGDLRTHAAMVLFEPVLRRHDRDAFELFIYDATTVRDDKSTQLRSLVDHWRYIDTQPIFELPDMVFADGIDILVDLSGHTPNNRLMSFACKPAPVQASWLAYPGSTGLTEIDYLISDPHTSPAHLDRHASEKVWRLPNTRFCYQPPADVAELPPRAPARPVTFGSFNNISKINPAVLALWRTILASLPEAQLLIKSLSLDDPVARRLFEADLASAGLPGDRVTLRGSTSQLDNFADYGLIDIALDPFPFCGGLTSLDALWMGVPVITLEQELMAGRQTLAFLKTIGHPEWIAPSADDYVRIAVELAQEPEHLHAYHGSLRAALRASPLLDFDRFTCDLEQAYRSMWQTWCSTAP